MSAQEDKKTLAHRWPMQRWLRCMGVVAASLFARLEAVVARMF